MKRSIREVLQKHPLSLRAVIRTRSGRVLIAAPRSFVVKHSTFLLSKNALPMNSHVSDPSLYFYADNYL